MGWPHISDSVVSARVGGQLLMLNRETCDLFVADSIGSFVIEHREHFQDLPDAALGIADAMQVAPADVSAGLQRFASDLQHLNRTRSASRPRATLRERLRLREPASVPGGTGRTIMIDALGVGMALVLHDPQTAQRLEMLLDALPRHSSPQTRIDVWKEGTATRVAVDGRQGAIEWDDSLGISRVLAIIMALAVDESPADVLIHSAGVVIDGGAVLLAGSSNQGKSSTTMELMRGGATYLTDEVVALEPRTAVVSGFARPIGLEGPIRERYADLQPQWWTAQSIDPRWAIPAQLIGDVAVGATLGAVVFLQYDRDSRDEIHRLEPLESLTRLLPLLYDATRLDDDSLGRIIGLLESTPCFLVRHSGAERAAELVRRLVAGAT